jgi:hypothetical protein
LRTLVPSERQLARPDPFEAPAPDAIRDQRSAISIAAEHDISAYHASYVGAAHRESWTLVSTDVEHLVSKGLAITPDAAV